MRLSNLCENRFEKKVVRDPVVKKKLGRLSILDHF